MTIQIARNAITAVLFTADGKDNQRIKNNKKIKNKEWLDLIMGKKQKKIIIRKKCDEV